MKKILFVAEAVSLAHVARPGILAKSLDCAEYEVVFASNGQFGMCVADANWETYFLESLSTEIFLQRLAHGRPVYQEPELAAYVLADMKMLKAVAPDGVVGDFRLSLAISARLLGLPYFSICNAYWSEFAMDKRMHAPDLPIARLIGFPLFDQVFRLAWPVASRSHCGAINGVRRKYGLKPYRSIREYYCDGDIVMYSDSLGLVPTIDLPASHHYIGPILWSPSMVPPPWWAEAIAQPRPRAYITLGSTGTIDLLPAIVAACLDEGMTCFVATAGRSSFVSNSPYVFTSDFLPGSAVAAMVDLVICNGGSPTAYQALNEGKPVFGICANLDQVMCMSALKRAGAGLYLRAGEFTHARARQAISVLQKDRGFQAAAKILQGGFGVVNPCLEFERLIESNIL